MSMFTTTVQINRPRAEVFDFMSDLRNAQEWSTELLDRTYSGDIRLGTTGVDTLRVAGRELTAPWVVTAYDPPETVVVDFAGAFAATARFSFAEADSGASTVLACTTDLHPKGLLRFLAPIIAKEGKRADEAQFQKAKEILEDREGVGK